MGDGPPDRLSVDGLRVSGPGGTPVHDATLDVHGGEVVAVVGASGAGKTLTLRALLGLLPRGLSASARRFEILARGRRHTPLTHGFAPIRGPVLGWLPQDAGAALDPLRAVGLQVARAARLGGHPADPRPWLVRAGLDDPEDTARRLPDELSGGMARRVVLAQALAVGARFLLADEPVTGLDPVRAAAVLDDLAATARATGRGVLWVTHDLRTVPRIADRIVVFDRGRVVEHLDGGDPTALTSAAGRNLLDATRAIAAGGLG